MWHPGLLLDGHVLAINSEPTCRSRVYDMPLKEHVHPKHQPFNNAFEVVLRGPRVANWHPKRPKTSPDLHDFAVLLLTDPDGISESDMVLAASL